MMLSVSLLLLLMKVFHKLKVPNKNSSELVSILKYIDYSILEIYVLPSNTAYNFEMGIIVKLVMDISVSTNMGIISSLFITIIYRIH